MITLILSVILCVIGIMFLLSATFMANWILQLISLSMFLFGVYGIKKSQEVKSNDLL